MSQLLLGVSVDKDCTISDWESVPLSNPQIRYAAVDGLVVLVVHDILQNLHENGGCSSKVVTWNVDVNGRAQRKKVCGKLGSLVHCIGNVDDEDAEDEDADVAADVDGNGILLCKYSRAMAFKYDEVDHDWSKSELNASYFAFLKHVKPDSSGHGKIDIDSLLVRDPTDFSDLPGDPTGEAIMQVYPRKLELLDARYEGMEPKEVVKRLLGNDVTGGWTFPPTDEPVDHEAPGVVVGELGGMILTSYLQSLSNDGWEIGGGSGLSVKEWLETQLPTYLLYPAQKACIEQALKFLPKLEEALQKNQGFQDAFPPSIFRWPESLAWVHGSRLHPGRLQVVQPASAAHDGIHILRGICAEHARRSLRTSYKALFMPPADGVTSKKHTSNIDETYKKMRADSIKYGGLPNPHHERAVGELMLAKWREKYKEPKIADQFKVSWLKEGTHLTRAALHSFGGIPCDNNGLEGKNGGQKTDLEWKRHGLNDFINHFVAWLGNESMEDLNMASTMATCSNKPHDVWNATIFGRAKEQYDLFFTDGKELGIFGYRYTRLPDANGIVLYDIPSRDCLKMLYDHYKIPEDPKHIKHALLHVDGCTGSRRGCDFCDTSWYGVYRRLQVSQSHVPRRLNHMWTRP